MYLTVKAAMTGWHPRSTKIARDIREPAVFSSTLYHTVPCYEQNDISRFNKNLEFATLYCTMTLPWQNDTLSSQESVYIWFIFAAAQCTVPLPKTTWNSECKLLRSQESLVDSRGATGMVPPSPISLHFHAVLGKNLSNIRNYWKRRDEEKDCCLGLAF